VRRVRRKKNFFSENKDWGQTLSNGGYNVDHDLVKFAEKSQQTKDF